MYYSQESEGGGWSSAKGFSTDIRDPQGSEDDSIYCPCIGRSLLHGTNTLLARVVKYN